MWEDLFFICLVIIIGGITIDVTIRTLKTVHATSKEIWDWWLGKDKKAEDDLEMALADDAEDADIDWNPPAPISIKEMPCPHCGKQIEINVSLEHSEKADSETGFQSLKKNR